MFRTLFSILSFSFFTLIFGIYGVLLSLIFPNLAVKAVIRPWAKCSLRSFGVKLLVDGIENLPEEPSIIMYNHQSSFDILAFCAGLPIEWRAMMKEEVARIPFVGWVPRLTGHYFVSIRKFGIYRHQGYYLSIKWILNIPCSKVIGPSTYLQYLHNRSVG